MRFTLTVSTFLIVDWLQSVFLSKLRKRLGRRFWDESGKFRRHRSDLTLSIRLPPSLFAFTEKRTCRTPRQDWMQVVYCFDILRHQFIDLICRDFWPNLVTVNTKLYLFIIFSLPGTFGLPKTWADRPWLEQTRLMCDRSVPKFNVTIRYEYGSSHQWAFYVYVF